MPANAFGVTSRAACPASAPEPRSDSHQPGRAAEILTISDNPILAVYLSGLFEQCGWTIARTSSCGAGLSFLRENRAAVAVCEEVLPDGSWHDAAAALGYLPDAPALVVVGEDEALGREVSAFGGFDVLVRPLRQADVLWTIASAWHAWKKRCEAGGNGGLPCSGA